MTPQETDIKLAELYYSRLALERKRDDLAMALKQVAGAEFYYVGRRRVTNMPMEDARRRLEAALADPPANFREVYKRGYHTLRAELTRLDDQEGTLAQLQEDYTRIDGEYQGWARYFLTVSSRGHVHSSMVCSSCRPKTVFGWLPHLAGKGEIAVVDEHGPVLCSVCFPAAPSDWKQQDVPFDEGLRRMREMAHGLNLEHQELFVRRYGQRR